MLGTCLRLEKEISSLGVCPWGGEIYACLQMEKLHENHFLKKLNCPYDLVLREGPAVVKFMTTTLAILALLGTVAFRMAFLIA